MSKKFILAVDLKDIMKKLSLVPTQEHILFTESFGQFLNRINSDDQRSIKFSINLREMFNYAVLM